jgi:hypothetical protein
VDPKPVSPYHQRNAKASTPYGLVEDNFDLFEQIYDERFAHIHGHWRPIVRRVADAFEEVSVRPSPEEALSLVPLLKPWQPHLWLVMQKAPPLPIDAQATTELLLQETHHRHRLA